MTLPTSSLLFVCTGNICRSPMAAGIMRKVLEENGLAPVVVRSAGAHALVGSSPAPEAVEVCRDLGVDISEHQARQLDPHMISSARMILVMETWHVDEVLSLDRLASPKTFLLGSFSPRNPQVEIPDPIGRPMSYYRNCVRLITDAVEGLYESKLRPRG